MPVTLKELALDEAREIPKLFPIRGLSETVSMNVIDHVPLLILRSRSLLSKEVESEKRYESVEDVTYSLYTSREASLLGRDDGPITPDTEWVGAGVIEFQETGEGAGDMAVVLADLQPYLHGRGVGKYIYKAALNDLLDLGYERRYSDEKRSRSVHAERVWMSLARGNPERVAYKLPESPPAGAVMFDKETTERFGRWHVVGYVERRPVHVAAHRRRT